MLENDNLLKEEYKGFVIMAKDKKSLEKGLNALKFDDAIDQLWRHKYESKQWSKNFCIMDMLRHMYEVFNLPFLKCFKEYEEKNGMDFEYNGSIDC